jgi:hypothetical protein
VETTLCLPGQLDWVCSGQYSVPFRCYLVGCWDLSGSHLDFDDLKKKSKAAEPTKRKTEYREGHDALDSFAQTMEALFRIPKSVVAGKIKNSRKKDKD